MIILSRGDDIASASVIDVTKDIHHITGNVVINTINPPNPNSSGMVLLIADNNPGPILSDIGNIKVQVSMVTNKIMFLMYDNITSKWYIQGGL